MISKLREKKGQNEVAVALKSQLSSNLATKAFLRRRPELSQININRWRKWTEQDKQKLKFISLF